MRHAAFALFLIACGGSSPKPAAAPRAVADGPTCDQVADHMILLIGADAKDAPEDAVDKVRIQLAKACTDTSWSRAARQCVMDAKVGNDTNRCEPMFTDAQRQAFGHGPEPEAAPPPPPAPPPPAVEPALSGPANNAHPADLGPPAKSTKAAKKAKGRGADSDPCDGGE